MKSKDKIVLLGLIISFGLLLTIPSITGIQRDQTISTVAEKDTYVNSYDPTSNFGGQDYALSGFYFTGDFLEAYFYFNFFDKPTDYTKAEISLDFWSVSQTINFTVCLIEEEWDEFTMTWITGKPSKGQVIEYLIVASDSIYTIDITSLIAGRTNISICVYIELDNYVEDYAYIYSREGYYSDEDAPQLIWTYMETAEITVTNPTSSSNWEDFSTYTIRWTSVGSIEDVKIDLYKGATFVEEITYLFGYTDNDGEFDFYVSYNEDYEGADYRIKITDYDDANVYDYSDYFSFNAGGNGLPPGIPSYNVIIIMALISIFAIIFVKKARNKRP